MFNFGRTRERDLVAELSMPQDEKIEAGLYEDTSEPQSRFSDAEYERIFSTLTIEELRAMSVAELAGLAALTLAAVEDEVGMLGKEDEFTVEIAADYARASALGNLALLKQAGVPFQFLTLS